MNIKKVIKTFEVFESVLSDGEIITASTEEELTKQIKIKESIIKKNLVEKERKDTINFVKSSIEDLIQKLYPHVNTAKDDLCLGADDDGYLPAFFNGIFRDISEINVYSTTSIKRREQYLFTLYVSDLKNRTKQTHLQQILEKIDKHIMEEFTSRSLEKDLRPEYIEMLTISVNGFTSAETLKIENLFKTNESRYIDQFKNLIQAKRKS